MVSQVDQLVGEVSVLADSEAEVDEIVTDVADAVAEAVAALVSTTGLLDWTVANVDCCTDGHIGHTVGVEIVTDTEVGNTIPALGKMMLANVT